MCLVSIITPCYNHGKYLDDAVASIDRKSLSYELEHIIVNDGSTDPFTLEKLIQLENTEVIILHQDNLGLAAARNNAIKMARGKYILPLDSDNKLHEHYLINAVNMMEQDNTIDVVYGDSLFFGEENRLRKNRPFDIVRQLNSGYIDACAIYRKTVWEQVGGYDGNMPVMGSEDWEFWVGAFFKGAKLVYLDKLCFYYRVTPESMNRNITQFGFDRNRDYILRKYAHELYSFYQKYYHKIGYFKRNRFMSAISHLLGKIEL